MREPAWIVSSRWHLLSLSDWFAERRMWRASIAIDRLVLAIYRAFAGGGRASAKDGQKTPPLCAGTVVPHEPLPVLKRLVPLDLTDNQLDSISQRGSQTLASAESRRALMRASIDADRELNARGTERVRGAWERRQGHRGTNGSWFWDSWTPCTETEAKRVTGLRSWDVRQLPGAMNLGEGGKQG